MNYGRIEKKDGKCDRIWKEANMPTVCLAPVCVPCENENENRSKINPNMYTHCILQPADCSVLSVVFKLDFDFAANRLRKEKMKYVKFASGNHAMPFVRCLLPFAPKFHV